MARKKLPSSQSSSSKSSGRQKQKSALAKGPKNLSKLPKGLQDYWRKKRAGN